MTPFGPITSMPDPSIPTVSVVIVGWNTRDLLRNCIASIIAQTTAAVEIIVIDNASHDGSVQMVQEEFPHAILIENVQNRGFSAANNQGLAIAKGANVLLLNPDTVILNGAIDRMLAWLESNPDVGCVGCQVLQAVDRIQHTCFADPGLCNLAIVEFGLMRFAKIIPIFGRPWYLNWDRQSQRDVDVVSGMFMLVPCRVLRKVGVLDEAFFVYSEEADWCRRIRNAGWRCVFAPEAQILHLDGGSKSTAQVRSKMYVQLQKSALIYLRKHEGLLAAALYKLIVITAAVLRRIVFGVLRILKTDDATRARVRLANASLMYHLVGREPES